MEEEKKQMTVQEAGRLGGIKTASTYGKDFYQMIGAKGGNKVKERYGKEHYSAIGMKGGASRAANR